MNDNLRMVTNFYSEERMINELEDSSRKHRLKIWEKDTIKHFPQKANILNIGCGMGREAFCLYELGFSVIGIDISEQAIIGAKKIAEEINMNVNFLQTNGLDLPFDDSTFDVIIIWNQTFGLLYGNHNKEYVINECRRVLKKNGILSFSGHNFDYVQRTSEQYCDGRKFFAYANTDCYWELFKKEELLKYAETSGFTVLACETGSIYEKEVDSPIFHCECIK
jgi:ubiquinone/menaquinone biosynthesis C-methylase UbiE